MIVFLVQIQKYGTNNTEEKILYLTKREFFGKKKKKKKNPAVEDPQVTEQERFS